MLVAAETSLKGPSGNRCVPFLQKLVAAILYSLSVLFPYKMSSSLFILIMGFNVCFSCSQQCYSQQTQHAFLRLHRKAALIFFLTSMYLTCILGKKHFTITCRRTNTNIFKSLCIDTLNWLSQYLKVRVNRSLTVPAWAALKSIVSDYR